MFVKGEKINVKCELAQNPSGHVVWEELLVGLQIRWEQDSRAGKSQEQLNP